MSVLVTGFTPFGPHSSNASEHLMHALGDVKGLHALVIPTSYQRGADAVFEALEHQPYSGIILFGLAASAKHLRLEQIALNLSDPSAADNDNEVLPRGPILPAAPVAYRSTLPLTRMADLAAEAGEPVEWSRDAGGYVCNHTFFRVMHHAAERQSLPCGFVHLPNLEPASERLGRVAAIVQRWASEL